ncbi:hypothetical protein ACHQM5_015241 [Ranunculus cassubicifolius]
MNVNWDSLGRIPYDLLFDLLIKQSVKTLCVLKCVSTVWRSIILNPHLLEKVVCTQPFKLDVGGYGQDRLDLVAIDRNGFGEIVDTRFLDDYYEDIKTLKFHKGLIIYFNHLEQIFVHNKTAGYGYALPDIEDCLYLEFGFDPSCNKYKVLCWTSKRFYVLTIGEFSWKPIRGLHLDEIHKKNHDSIVINGNVFWLCKRVRSIVYFNLADERFGIIRVPPDLNINSTFTETCTLFEFDSRLCLVQCYGNLLHLDISEMWILKNIRNSTWVSIMNNPTTVPVEGANLVTCAPYEAQFFSTGSEILVATSDSNRHYIFVYCLLTRQFRRIDVNGVEFTHVAVRLHVDNYVRFPEYESSSEEDDDDDECDVSDDEQRPIQLPPGFRRIRKKKLTEC